MAKQNLGKIIMTPKGVYNNSTAYEFLDVITYNGSSYVCKQASTGNLPTTDYWQLLANQGDKPVVGVDYFTEDDKKEIADSVIESSSEDTDELFNALPSNTATGTEINISDSINCRCIETKFNGISIQDGEPNPTTPVEIESLGYENLFTTSEVWFSGIPTYNEVDNIFTFHRDAGADYIIKYGNLKLKPNTDYVLYFDIIENTMDNTFSMVNANAYLHGETAIINAGETGLKTFPVKTKEESTTYDLWFYCSSRGYLKAKIMLIEGTVAHAYVPYGKYGVGVKTVSKNLAKPRDITGNGYNGITGITNADGSFTISGTCTGDMGINLMSLTTAPILLENGKSYTQKLFLISGSGDFKIVPYVLNLDGTTTYNYFTSTIESPTFTRKVDGDKTVTGYQFYCLKGATVNVTFKVQLEEGTVATDYVPYQGNISVIPLNEPLRSLPNGVKDIAYIRNNKLYVDRYVGSVVLNGSESWSNQITTNSYNRYDLIISNIKPNESDTNIGNIISDYFPTVTPNNIWLGNMGIGVGTNQQKLLIMFKSQNTETLETFKTWLSTNNVQVDYELATPVTEYLGTIKDLPRTFEGISNITAESNMDNIELEIKYAQDIKAYINNLIK